MKKFIKIFAVGLVVIIAGVPLFHYYCDDVYEHLAFSKNAVVQVDDSIYRCSKDEYDDFLTYMKNDGWKEVDQLGSCIILEKNGKQINCHLKIKKFYAEWKVYDD